MLSLRLLFLFAALLAAAASAQQVPFLSLSLARSLRQGAPPPARLTRARFPTGRELSNGCEEEEERVFSFFNALTFSLPFFPLRLETAHQTGRTRPAAAAAAAAADSPGRRPRPGE